MTATITLPFAAPPLRANGREHWAPRARQTKVIREAAELVARAIANREGPCTPPVIITGIWTVTDNRRRDPDGMAPSVKAAIDGCVPHLIPDDRAGVVAEVRYRIELGDRPGFRIEIQESA